MLDVPILLGFSPLGASWVRRQMRILFRHRRTRRAKNGEFTRCVFYWQKNGFITSRHVVLFW